MIGRHVRAAVALVVTVVAVACTRETPAPRTSDSTSSPAADQAFRPLSPGDSVPAYAAPTLAGDTVRVAAGGPLTLVNVWATWCTSCREEMADLEAMHRDFGTRGLRVVAVSVDDGDASRVRRFVESQKLTMPIALDPTGRIQQLYSVVGVPETFLVGADGKLVWRHAGGLHDDPAAARAAVEKALGAARPGA